MDSLFDDVLRLPPQVVLFELQRRLKALFPERHVFHTCAELFAADRFVYDKQATTKYRREVGELVERWADDENSKATARPVQRWETLTWNGREYEVITVTLRESGNTETSHFIVGDTDAWCAELFLAVCRWCSASRGEVLVFEEGCFRRSEQLFAQIQTASFDELILAPELGAAVRDDVRRFIDAKATYARHRVPWKRGLLLLGAPGNGKTHMVRALVRETKWQCLYVKSFRARNGDAEKGIAAVFARARRAAPCVVVLEDIDCLVAEESRSVLLNELDGFAQNEGLLIIATTNHPEKIDRSLLDRPSRFDRKFHFPLPAPRERQRYLEKWRESVEAELRFDDVTMQVLVDGSHGFTFAYLKELTFGAMMAFMDGARSMNDVAPEVLATLKNEMSSVRKMLPPLPEAERKISLSM